MINEDNPQNEDAVYISLDNGRIITFARDEEDAGSIQICYEDTCLTLPATAADLLAMVEFFNEVASAKGTHKEEP